MLAKDGAHRICVCCNVRLEKCNAHFYCATCSDESRGVIVAVCGRGSSRGTELFTVSTPFDSVLDMLTVEHCSYMLSS